MNKKLLSNNLANLNNELVTDLKSALDYELEKPCEKWNVKHIIDLSNAIAEIEGYNPTYEDIRRGTDAILSRLEHITSEIWR